MNNYTWNLEQILKIKDFNKNLKSLEKEASKFISKWNPKVDNGYRDDYLKDPKILKIALEEFDNWLAEYGSFGRIGYYYSLKSALDQNNSELKAKYNKVHSVGVRISNDINFFVHRISKIDRKLQSKFLKDKDLKEYKHFLETVFKESKYLLSESEEKILNIKSKTSYSNWVDLIESLLSKSERNILTEEGVVIDNYSSIVNKLDNKTKKYRESARDALNDIYESLVEVSEHEINSILEYKLNNDELRGFKRVDESRHLGDDIDTVVVDALIDSVTNNFDISKKYYQLKAKELNLKNLRYFERNIKVGSIESKYTYEETLDILRVVFNKLDTKYLEVLNSFINEDRIDVYPKKGKSSGAFCSYNSRLVKPFILLNFEGKLRDISTLAHEMGHGIHFTLMSKQNSLNYGAPMSTAEVASTFFEDFVIEHLSQNLDKEQKRILMFERLNDEIATIQRQTSFYNFELDLHRNFRNDGYLSHKQIGELFIKNIKAYLGDSVLIEEGNQNWWMGITHIRNYFYVYSYASGLLISKALQSYVRSDPSFIKDVTKFFETGSSLSPKDIFNKLGINISDNKFWLDGLNTMREDIKLLE